MLHVVVASGHWHIRWCMLASAHWIGGSRIGRKLDGSRNTLSGILYWGLSAPSLLADPVGS